MTSTVTMKMAHWWAPHDLVARRVKAGVSEQATDAIIIHHPDASYFNAK